jgi:hypothetical protein
VGLAAAARARCRSAVPNALAVTGRMAGLIMVRNRNGTAIRDGVATVWDRLFRLRKKTFYRQVLKLGVNEASVQGIQNERVPN